MKKVFWISLLIIAGWVGATFAYVSKSEVPATTFSNTNSVEEDEVTGEEVTLEGRIVCLPHAKTDGPITLECALGLQTAQGEHYALRDTTSDYSMLGAINTESDVIARGKLEANKEQKYATKGTLVLTSLQRK